MISSEPGHGVPEGARGRERGSRRARVRAAARALAVEGGYEAVTMHTVASRAGVARATLYRDFASKDQLLAEVTAAWVAEVVRSLRASPPRGSAPERVSRALVRALAAARREPRLAAALLASASSPAPEARRTQEGLGVLVREALAVAEAPGEPDRPVELETLMGHVFFSAFAQTAAGRIEHTEAVAALESAARIFFRGQEDTPGGGGD